MGKHRLLQTLLLLRNRLRGNPETRPASERHEKGRRLRGIARGSNNLSAHLQIRQETDGNEQRKTEEGTTQSSRSAPRWEHLNSARYPPTHLLFHDPILTRCFAPRLVTAKNSLLHT